MIKKITFIDLKDLPEGMRLSFTYSVLDETGKIVDSNVKDSFVVLDDLTVDDKNIREAIDLIFKAANNHLK